MDQRVKQRIEALARNGSANVLSGGRKGIEKESLRVRPDGTLADTPHPRALGSAMTNAFITTDFSEALLEFVTPAYLHTWEALRTLCEIHQFTYERIGEELLWGTSMPCAITTDEAIPIAQYGNSNIGTMKTVYRKGLSYRYGRRMQTIAGVHFNYSLPAGFWPQYHDLEKSPLDLGEFRSEAYMGLVRNFRRLGWLVLYLFGASPALCRSFMGDVPTDMKVLDGTTYFEPFATSLRMSDLGYSNRTQAKLRISLNSLGEYIRDLSCAICTIEPAYRDLGVKVDGEFRQLSASQLQIENEYYSPIRPKRVARSGERPTAALHRGGVEYVEVRSLDVNVFDPTGINQNAMRFVEAFLVYCLLYDSPPFDDRTFQEVLRNHGQTARHGRDPEFRLYRDGREIALRDWARDIVMDVRAIAEIIDRGEGGDDYVQAVDAQIRLVDEPDATPSARVLEEMQSTGLGFFEFALESARGHKEYFAALAPLDGDRLRIYEDEAVASIERQRQIEASDTMNFDDYLEKYFSEQGCCE